MKINKNKSTVRSLLIAICGLVVLGSGQLSAQAVRRGGGGSTGGGDTCERKIQEIRNDIRHWVFNDGARIRGLKVLNDNYAAYRSAMLTALDTPTTIECVSSGVQNPNPVKISGVSKTCKFERISGGMKLTCDLEKFNNDSEDERYVMIHHEYAGYAGLEDPNGPRSKYHLSNQLSGSMEFVTLRRLSLKPVAVLTASGELTAADALAMSQDWIVQQAIDVFQNKLKNAKSLHNSARDGVSYEVEPGSVRYSIAKAKFGFGNEKRYFQFDLVISVRLKGQGTELQCVSEVSNGLVFDPKKDALGKSLNEFKVSFQFTPCQFYSLDGKPTQLRLPVWNGMMDDLTLKVKSR